MSARIRNFIKAALVSTFVPALVWAGTSHAAADPATTVITGVTVIDGNGGAPLEDGVIVISDHRIAKVGRRGQVEVPRRAKTIDAQGKFVIPGIIDTNVHLDLNMELFPLLVYGGDDAYFQHSLAVEGAQMALKYGLTTIMDTYGPLLPLLKVRDRIKSGEIVGPRLLVAGNILGWDGPFSPSESKRNPADLKLWEKNHSVWFTQGTGAALTQMYQDEVIAALNKYIDLGPDFIKIGVTTHAATSPITLSFSPRVLKAMVDAAHARGLKVQAHSGTVEGHKISVEAGIDIITHAESIYAQKLRADFAKDLCNSGTSFALFGYAAVPAYNYLRTASGAGLAGSTEIPEEKRKAIESITPDRNRTPRLPQSLESRLPGAYNPVAAFRKENQEALYQAGCKVVIATDAHPAMYDDLVSYAKSHADMGIGTIDAIVGLVQQIGMKPMEVIVAATKNGAAAAGLLDRIGTVEEGKLADLVVLDGDPLADIENIRRVHRVVHDGVVIDPKALPVRPKFYKR